jgi:hypothetical protein
MAAYYQIADATERSVSPMSLQSRPPWQRWPQRTAMQNQQMHTIQRARATKLSPREHICHLQRAGANLGPLHWRSFFGFDRLLDRRVLLARQRADLQSISTQSLINL